MNANPLAAEGYASPACKISFRHKKRQKLSYSRYVNRLIFIRHAHIDFFAMHYSLAIFTVDVVVLPPPAKVTRAALAPLVITRRIRHYIFVYATIKINLACNGEYSRDCTAIVTLSVKYPIVLRDVQLMAKALEGDSDKRY